MQISGIYKIESKLFPSKIYIGSAINIGKRWSEHLRILRLKEHHSGKLQNHYNKYGEGDLQFSILLGCPKEDLIKTEQYFIDSYNPYFNICKIAGSQLGMKRTEEQKQRMRKPKTRKDGYKLRKPITEEIREKLRKSHRGYKATEETIQKLRIIHLGSKRSEEQRQNMRISQRYKCKPVFMLDKETNEILKRFDSQMDAILFIKPDVIRRRGFPLPGLIRRAVQGKVNSAYGYKWRYAS